MLNAAQNFNQKTAFSNQLYNTYNWFNGVFPEKIKRSMGEFFGCDLELKLLSISENDNTLFKGETYFVTQIRLSKNFTVGIRLSDIATGKLLESALGKNSVGRFNMEDLTELEVKIITSFNDFLYENVRPALIPDELIDKTEEAKSLCHLFFYLKKKSEASKKCTLSGVCEDKDEDYGKLIITIPTNIIEATPVITDSANFAIGDFPNSKAYVKIKIGQSLIKLIDIKSLEIGDIILLEKSDLYSMTICEGDIEIPFKISPDPSIILNEGSNRNDNGSDNMSNNVNITPENMWDTIQVEIQAEFERVKISLGELKQISEGLVVDIGSIYENRVDLKVENKLVARGELVIINDRYGVRIDELIKEAERAQQQAPQQAAPLPQQPQQQQTIVEDIDVDDFNTKEFEDEDFNYDDLDDDSI